MREDEKRGHFHLVVILRNWSKTLTKTAAHSRFVIFIFVCVTKVDTLSRTALNNFIQLIVLFANMFLFLFRSKNLR